METLKLLTAVFIMFSVVDTAAVPLGCTWMQSRFQHLNDKSIELLMTMSGPIPLKCLEKEEKLEEVAFPQDAFQEPQNLDVAVVALEILTGVQRLFKSDQTSVTWDREKLGRFKNIVSSRQVENLQKCVGEDSPSAYRILGKLRSSFDNLEEHLRVNEFSECAWEIVREEVKLGLKKFQEFLNRQS